MKLLNIINENEGPIDENLALIFRAAGKNLSKVKGAFDDVFKFAADSGQPFYKAGGKKGGIFQSSDELMKAMKAGQLTSEAATQLAQGLLKTNKCPLDIQKMLVSEIASGSNWNKLLGTVKTERGLINRWKKKQYTDETIELMLQKAKDQKVGPYGKTGSKSGGKSGSNAGGKKSTTDGGKAATNTNKVKDAIDAGKQQVQNLQTLVKKYPILKAVKAVVSVPLFVLRWFGKFKLLKWLIILGVGGFIYFNYEEWLAGGGKPIDDDTDFEPEIDFLKCILIPLGDDDGVEIKKENDNPVVYVKTGTSYDDKGGLIFRVGGSVETGDGSKKGTWSCNKSGLNIQEQSTGKDMTSKQLSVVMDDLNDNLSGDLIDGDSTDMVDALNIVKGLQGKFYKSVSAIKTLKHNYPKVYKTSLIDDINNLSNLDFEGMEKKEELLSILGLSSGNSGGNSGGNNKGDSDVKFDGNKKTGISHITIKWNDDKGGVTPVPGGKVKYVQCNDLPFKYGCISDKIKTIQKCLPSELKVDGYYGPKTSNALWNLYQGKEKGDITKSVYDKIVAKCNKKDNKVKSTKPRKKLEPITKIEPKGIEPLKRYDTEMVISQIDPEKMAKQIQKTIDGRRIDQIIKNELEYSRGRYVLKIDDELTENQLKTINLYMATKGFKVLRKKRETLDGSKYVWKADSRDAKRIARRERSIKKDQNKIEDIKNKDNE